MDAEIKPRASGILAELAAASKLLQERSAAVNAKADQAVARARQLQATAEKHLEAAWIAVRRKPEGIAADRAARKSAFARARRSAATRLL